MNSQKKPTRIGLWIVGARGSVATCVAYGLAGLEQGLIEPIGVATEAEPFDRIDWVPFNQIALGGCDVSQRALTTSAGELVNSGILPAELVAGAAKAAAAYEAHIVPGILDDADVGLADLDPESARLGTLSARERIAHVQAQLTDFQKQTGAERLIVINVASTEALREPEAAWNSLADFDASMDAGQSPPASVIYAYAALDAGHAHVNFTPSLGASLPALQELAEQRGVPHCGSDGKTGETLVKTVLGPMFTARAMRVLAWQGYNMLGNRDGEVLNDPLHKETKVRGKDEALRSILKDDRTHTHVGIDYVPSLRDWKTAWDFVHFEGFFGARMSLQFTWSGSDSALAAPLVIDLARWTDLAMRRGETGVMTHVASYFKAPLVNETHDFHAQFRLLLDYLERCSS